MCQPASAVVLLVSSEKVFFLSKNIRCKGFRHILYNTMEAICPAYGIMGLTDGKIAAWSVRQKGMQSMALEHRKTMTVEEYFLLEQNDPDTRYEYVDGYVYAMAGGSFNHDTIKSNIHRILWGLLRGGKCRVYSSDMRVYISKERYFHPDVTVTCDPRDRGRGDLVQS